MRLLWIMLGLGVAVLVPFALWGDWWETVFSLAGVRQWLLGLGKWAWLGGIGLLVGDLVLPVPGTVLMSGLGWLYGWFWGGLAASAGSFLSGTVAYALCRQLGEKAARWIVGEKDFEKNKQLSERHGPWIIALSRTLPILPEVTTCLAGVTRMPARKFFISLACGSLPTGFLYAAVGSLGETHATLAFWASLLLPVLLYTAARPLLNRKKPG